jgi:methylenetetrahydrofolate reductase (NADPH)
LGMREAIASGETIITGEVAPPKGCHLEHMVEEGEFYRGLVAGINVTDIQSSVMRASSLVGCIKLQEAGLPPVLQMVCRDRNRLALQSELLSAAALGITDVLCLTGDYTTLGDHPQAKPVFDLDSVSLLKAGKTLMEGKDMAFYPDRRNPGQFIDGEELDGDPPDFCLGCVVNPGAEPLDPQIYKLKAKIDAGAEFCQTQAVYDPQRFETFMEKVGDVPIPILAGIVVLKSPMMGKFMTQNVAGVIVPDWMIEALAEKETRVEKSIEMSAQLVTELAPMCQGVHMMPLGWDKHVPAILERAGLVG